VRPGRTTAEIASVWPKAQEFGFPDEEAAFALQFRAWNRIGDLGKAGDQPDGFAGALARNQGRGWCLHSRTFWPSTRWMERGAHRGRDVVTATGHEVITRFPAEKLMVAERTIHGGRPAFDYARERGGSQQHVKEMVAGAKREGVAASD